MLINVKHDGCIKFSSYQSSNFSIDEYVYAIVVYDVEASIDL